MTLEVSVHRELGETNQKAVLQILARKAPSRQAGQNGYITFQFATA